MAEEMKGRVVGGEGKVTEVDGGYFVSYVKPANLKEKRKDRRFAENQSGKRKVVVIVRERGGASVPAEFNTESAASSFIRARNLEWRSGEPRSLAGDEARQERGFYGVLAAAYYRLKMSH
jgi:hypothetical protein